MNYFISVSNLLNSFIIRIYYLKEVKTMNNYKKGIESLKVPLLIMSMVVIFSFGFHTVSAADTSHIYVSPSGSDTWNGQAATHISSILGPKKTIKSGVSTIRSGGVLKLASGTYNENNIVISKSMTIQGTGVTKTTINGNYRGKIFTINNNAKVSISGVSLIKGKSSYGGAIHNGGTLSLSNCNLRYNICPNYGGAIYNGGNLASNLVTFTRNSATNGAGILNDNGANMVVTNTVFSYNNAAGSGSGKGYGGAIQNIGKGTIAHDYFIYNTGFEGAVIFNCGNLNVNYANFRYNKALSDAGAIDTYHGITTLSHSIFYKNHSNIFGGALYVDTDEGITDKILSDLIVQSCTFTGNTANLDGGVIHNYRGKVSVSNSNFVNNTSGRYGGAISNWYGTLNTVTNIFTNNIARLGLTINQWH